MSIRQSSTRICTCTMSITVMSTKAGKARSRTGTYTGMCLSAIATAMSSTCTISAGRHEVSTTPAGALQAPAHLCVPDAVQPSLRASCAARKCV